MWYFLTLSLQNVLGYTPLQTGLAFLPHTLVAILVTTQVTPWLMARVDSRVVIAAGGVLAAGGFWWQSRLDPTSGYLAGILGPAVVFSAGSGLLNTPVTTAVTAGVGPADAGAASGLVSARRTECSGCCTRQRGMRMVCVMMCAPMPSSTSVIRTGCWSWTRPGS